jgi:hypothetical protein
MKGLAVNTSTQPSIRRALKYRYAAALILVFGSAWLLQPRASAQLGLGSLVVTITAPTAGSTVSGTTTVRAQVSVVGALTVSNVQFKLDGNNLGAADSSSPYSIAWDTKTAANGAHTLTAVARDILGVGWTSPAVNVTVFNDTTPPSVAISSPAPGASLRGTITIAANASDNVGVTGVQFKLNGVNLGAEDTASPYSIPWNTSTAGNGTYALTAVARDAAGNTATATTISVVIDNAPPAVSITAPAAGSVVGGFATISANASDNLAVAGVQFFVDGAAVGAEDLIAPYSVAWNTTNGTSGSHVLTATARDAAGNVTTSATVTVTVDNQGPTVAITSPAMGATVSGSITVSADASDNVAVAGVEFFFGNATVGVDDTTAPYSVVWDTTTVPDGEYFFRAIARDSLGNRTPSAFRIVTVSNQASDTVPPSVAITSPANGATLSASITVTADASDNVGVAGVQFLLDGVALGVEDTSAPYSAAWDTRTATDGAHTVSAMARDGAGNTTTSASIAVTVSNQTSSATRLEDSNAAISYTPAGSWLEGYVDRFGWSGGTAALGFTAGQRATLNFTGTAVSWIGFRGPQTGIANVYLDGSLVATIDAYSPTEILQAALYSATGLANGPHTLAIEVTRTKNDASSDFYVVVDAFDVTSQGGGAPTDTTPPSASITAPAGGATVTGTITVTANASDNVGVTGVKLFVDGVQTGVEDMAAPYALSWATATATNGAHTLTVVARDGAGNTTTSASVSVTVSNSSTPPAAVATRVEDTDLAITYIPGTTAPGQPPEWFHGSRSRDWSNDTASFNRSPGSRATFSFTGTSVSWIGFRAYWAGIARVYVDDVFVDQLDLFLPPCTPEQRAQGCVDEDDQAAVFTADGLAPGPHTLTIEVTGGRNANATDNAVVVDGFDVAPVVPTPIVGTRIEQTAAAVTYTAGWSQGDTSTAWSGATAAVSSTAGARATVTFTGTEVRWVGRRGPQSGIARIFLDGAFQAEFDQYFATDLIGVNYTATGLAPGSHTLTIEVTGTRNAAATGASVAVDAFDVRSRFEDRDGAVTYTGTWVQEHMGRPWSGTNPNYGTGTAARAAAAGASAEFTFSGSQVQWISTRGPSYGMADVSVDGIVIERVDLYAATEVMRAAVFTHTGLGPGTHRLRIDVTGSKNGASTGTFVFVDAFDVVLPQPAPVVTRIQQTDAAVAYTTPPGTAGWTQSNPNLFFSGRTVALATDAGARATFTFTGTSVRWIGQRRRDSGIARVYLNGALVGVVDTYSTVQDEFQAAMFSASGLGPGTHTLTIEATGTKHGGPDCSPGPAPPCSSGYMVIVDAFEVSQQ